MHPVGVVDDGLVPGVVDAGLGAVPPRRTSCVAGSQVEDPAGRYAAMIRRMSRPQVATAAPAAFTAKCTLPMNPGALFSWTGADHDPPAGRVATSTLPSSESASSSGKATVWVPAASMPRLRICSASPGPGNLGWLSRITRGSPGEAGKSSDHSLCTTSPVCVWRDCAPNIAVSRPVKSTTMLGQDTVEPAGDSRVVGPGRTCPVGQARRPIWTAVARASRNSADEAGRCDVRAEDACANVVVVAARRVTAAMPVTVRDATVEPCVDR